MSLESLTELDALLIEFISRCSASKVTPDEKVIDAYLNGLGKIKLREYFIKWCFLNWETRYEFLKKFESDNITGDNFICVFDSTGKA